MSVGDRLIELDENSLDFMDMDELVHTIQSGGQQLKCTLLAKSSKCRSRKKPEESAIFDTLHGRTEIDYKVQPRLFQQTPTWHTFET